MTARSQPRRSLLPNFPHWSSLVLAGLFVGYWLLMGSLERVNAHVILARYFMPELSPNQAEVTYFPAPLLWAVKLFHPRVWRHMIPLLIGWWLAVQASVSLIQTLYAPPDRRAAAEFLRRQRSGKAGSLGTPFEALPKNLTRSREESISLSVGGPLLVTVPDGFAGVTEHNARYRRMLPAGTYALERFERLLDVVDLRPQTEAADGVRLLTREGLPLWVDISLTFQINPDEDPDNKAVIFGEQAIVKAAYGGAVGADGRVSSWTAGPLGKVKARLATWVSERTMDELVAAPQSADAHHLLTQNITEEVWQSLPKDGIKPLSLRIGRLSPPPEVSRQYTEFWLASQYKKDVLARAEGTAYLLQDAETANAAAEIAMIQAIIDGVRRAQRETSAKPSGYLVAIRLLESLRKMFESSASELQITGGDTGELLSGINAMDERLSDLENKLRTPPPKFIPSRSGSAAG